MSIKEIFTNSNILFQTSTTNEIVNLSSLQTTMTRISYYTSGTLTVENSGIFDQQIPLQAQETGISISKPIKFNFINNPIQFVDSTNYNGLSINVTSQLIEQSSETNTEYSFNSFGISFISATAGSVSKGSTFSILGAPLGSSANNYSLYIEDGPTFFGGPINVSTIIGGAGGSDTQIQYNNNGSFIGSSNLTWTSATNTLNISGLVSATTMISNYGTISWISSGIVSGNLLNVSSSNIPNVNIGYINSNIGYFNSKISASSIVSSNISNTTLSVNGPSFINIINANSSVINNTSVTYLNNQYSNFTSINANTAIINEISATTAIVTGPANFTGLININTLSLGLLNVTTLNVSGPSQFSGLITANSAIINELGATTLSVSGPSQFSGLITANTMVISGISITTLSVSGPSQFSGLITANSAIFSELGSTTLNVSGPSQFSGLLTVGTLNYNNDLYFNGYIYSKNTWKTSVLCVSNLNETIGSIIPGYVIDGVTLSENSRILLNGQTNLSENGIYIVLSTGAIRSEDAQVGYPADSNILFAEQGILGGNKVWICSEGYYGSSILFGDGTTGLPFNSIQFNNNGIFDGSENITWSTSTNTIYINNNIQVGSSATIGNISSTTMYVSHNELSELQTSVLSNWTTIVYYTENSSFYSVVYSNKLDLFVAVGAQDINGYGAIIVSTDAISWISVFQFEANAPYLSVVWSDTIERFVACGSPLLNNLAYSDDGYSWTTVNAPTTGDWRSVCVSNELKRFVSCALNLLPPPTPFTYEPLIYSNDGITWSTANVSTTYYLSNVIYTQELGLYTCITVSDPFLTGTVYNVLYSSDGIDWNTTSASTYGFWISLCWSAELGLLVATNNDTNVIMKSSDSIVWTSANSPTYNISTIAWSPQLSMFMGTNFNYDPIQYSTDLVTWQTLPYVGNTISWQPSINSFMISSTTGFAYSNSSFFGYNQGIFLGSRVSNTSIEGNVVNIGSSSYEVNIGLYANEVNIGPMNINGTLSTNSLVYSVLDTDSGNAVGIVSGQVVDTVSLERYKEDINNAIIELLVEDINKLVPKKFKWIFDNTSDQGLIVDDALRNGLNKYIINDDNINSDYKNRSLITALIAGAKYNNNRLSNLEFNQNIN